MENLKSRKTTKDANSKSINRPISLVRKKMRART